MRAHPYLRLLPEDARELAADPSLTEPERLTIAELAPFVSWLEDHWAYERRRTGSVTVAERAYWRARVGYLGSQ